MSRESSWSSFATLCLDFYAVAEGGEAARGERWFAAMSRTASSELNVGGLLPEATLAEAADLVGVIGSEQPAIVFTSQEVGAGARQVFVDAGYEVTETTEPLMRCAAPPIVGEHGFRVVPADSEDALLECMTVASAAHHVPLDMLSASIGEAARRGAVQPWLGLDGDRPVCTVWMGRSGPTLGVMEMMTPLEHQRRGAGRAVLSTALRESWTSGVTESILLATPAGRRLYESLGFVAVDEGLTCYRGLDDDVLEAIGQPT